MENQHLIIEGKKIVIGEIILNGKIDVISATNLEKKFNEFFHEGVKYYIIDFSKVDFLSSSGIRILLFALKKTQIIKGNMALCNVSEQVEKVLSISGITPMIKLASSKLDALKHLNIFM